MTINQFSRIQHRRGLGIDLPNPLNTSELGHVVDEKRLFIGNGELAEGAPDVGNTEIITEWTLLNNPAALKHTYKSNTPVVASTGPSPSNPVVRSVVSVLDDRLSAKSYGLVGDGVADDSDDANRMMQDIYTVTIPGPTAPEVAYRAIYFPAGNYTLDLSTIYLPPNAVLIGDGPDRTIITMVNATNTSVISTADSDFQTNLQLGNGGATLPTNIFAYGISFVHTADEDVISLERASNVYFEWCKFSNGWAGGPSTSSMVHLDALGAVYNPTNIKFRKCIFDNGAYVVNIDGVASGSSEIYFEDCEFRNLLRGVYNTDVAKDIKVIGSVIENVDETFMYAGSGTVAMLSLGNTYRNCGSIGFPVIHFDTGSQNCISSNDTFENSGGENIVNNGTDNVVVSPQADINFQNMRVTGKKAALSLAPGFTNAMTGIEFDVTKEDSIFIDYTLKRDVGGNIYTRVGRIFISTDGVSGGTGTTLGDMFTESNPTGITFDFSLPAIPGDTLYVVYTASVGNPAELHYQIKSWSML